jgi:T5SS/PEP-CTERM-associated repeat protein
MVPKQYIIIKTKLFSKPILVGWSILYVSLVIALADQCIGNAEWTGSIGNWFVGTNWSGGVVPNGDTSAKINAGAATIASTGAVSCDLTLGAEQTQSGTLVVDGGTYSMTFDAAVAEYGKGVLTIKNGGSVTAAFAGIATQPGSNGMVSVSGGTLTIGQNGSLGVGGYSAQGGIGLLSITNGGTVTAGNVHVWNSGTLTGNGTVSVTSGTAVDGTVTPSGGTLSLGGDMTLSISAATQCNVTSQDVGTTPQINVSGTASLNGRVSVTMTGTFTCATTRYTLLQSQVALIGTFSNGVSIKYPTDQGFIPHITYEGNYVYLDLVFNNGCP